MNGEENERCDRGTLEILRLHNYIKRCIGMQLRQVDYERVTETRNNQPFDNSIELGK